MPLSGYGVWDRANEKDARDPQYSYLLGIRAEATWAEIQPNDSITYNWKPILDVLKKSDSTNQFVKISLFVGPDCPEWIYANGVPAVLTNDKNHPGWTKYPYYLDIDYKRHYFRLIKELSIFLRNQPENLLRHLSFVQVMTGCTGDEVAYKGIPLTASSVYKISDSEWSDFRLEAFSKFISFFNQGVGKKIGLLFNAIDPEKYLTEWQWVNNNIDPSIGFGIKGSAYMRGHHLTDELSFKKSFYDYLVNPKGMKLFSVAEMDQSWTKPLYLINIPLGFYWGMLGGLNTGLSVWDVSAGALNYADISSTVKNTFLFFNKYAPQIYPNDATSAYSIFHEGLNSADINKFPEYKYGKANQGNLDRYAAICNDSIYKSHGAKMDDLPAASWGQVAQRDGQNGYNDAGWDIQDGNYERWITQLYPDSTSIGLFRVRGLIKDSSSIYDRFARSFESSSGKNKMFFRFNNEMFQYSQPEKLTFKIIWLDKNAGSKWALKYFNKDGLQTAFVKTGVGDNEWKVDTVSVMKPIVGRFGSNVADFMLTNEDAFDDIFHGLEVDIVRSKLITGVNEPLNNINYFLNVRPNPTNSSIWWDQNYEIKSAVIYNALGVKVMGPIPVSGTLSLASLKTGIYIIKFYSKRGVTQSVSVIKI